MQFQLSVTPGLEPLLQAAARQLVPVGPQARDEAEWLLAELLAVDRSRLRSHEGDLPAPQREQYQRWLARRAAGEPFAYITGSQPFRRLNVQVSPAVLIPRADTEHLVEWAVSLLQGQPKARLLDACTGSGCVALALADELPDAEVHGSDLSAAALAVASANAQRLRLKVQWWQADVLSLPAGVPRFRLVTANPPYIAAGDPHLPALQHEPTLALVSGGDGLDCLRQLIRQAPAVLQPAGWLLLEHGHDQAQAVRELLATQGFCAVETRRDYGGNERVTGGQWHG